MDSRSKLIDLAAFLDRRVVGASPVNSIAVLARPDEIAACRDDAMESAERIARRMAADPAVSSLVGGVVPVAGLLAETAATLREREVARFPGWMAQIALSLPKLEVLRTEVRALGEDCWRVRFAVANSGYLPAYVSKRALERKVARGTVFHIHLPEGASLVGGVERIVGAQLEGHAPKQSLQAFAPQSAVTGDRAVAEWVVHGPRGTRIGLSARADRAGAVSTEITLD